MMYEKSFYRTKFDEVKDIVKLTVVAETCGIPKPSMSLFMKNDNFNYVISHDKLNKMFIYLSDRLHCF